MRREFPRKVRFEIIKRASDEKGNISCEGCGQRLGSKRFEIDHIIAEALVVDKSRDLTAADGQLLGIACCHRGGNAKTADDQRKIAKARRSESKIRYGERKRSRWRKPPPGSRWDWGKGRRVMEDGR